MRWCRPRRVLRNDQTVIMSRDTKFGYIGRGGTLWAPPPIDGNTKLAAGTMTCRGLEENDGWAMADESGGTRPPANSKRMLAATLKPNPGVGLKGAGAFIPPDRSSLDCKSGKRAEASASASTSRSRTSPNPRREINRNPRRRKRRRAKVNLSQKYPPAMMMGTIMSSCGPTTNTLRQMTLNQNLNPKRKPRKGVVARLVAKRENPR
mmetsp:Transcript_61034/g.180604  ORF Transcript_61034/g.180604 Transcript_61034/m.180604 type:complete len:207 (+) Transcript_61034:396-1016(+)